MHDVRPCPRCGSPTDTHNLDGTEIDYRQLCAVCFAYLDNPENFDEVEANNRPYNWPRLPHRYRIK